MAAGVERVDHQDVSTCIVAILLVWWCYCLQVVWSWQGSSASPCGWEPYQDCPQPPLQAMCCCADQHCALMLADLWAEPTPAVPSVLLVLAVLQIAVLPIAETDL